MSTKTTNFEFIKPEKTDPADITATNENWDKLDEALINRDKDLSMGGHKITNVAEPTSRSDVATKGFVEDFSIEGSTYVAVDENKDGNIILRPYIPLADDFKAELLFDHSIDGGVWNKGETKNFPNNKNYALYLIILSGYSDVLICSSTSYKSGSNSGIVIRGQSGTVADTMVTENFVNLTRPNGGDNASVTYVNGIRRNHYLETSNFTFNSAPPISHVYGLGEK